MPIRNPFRRTAAGGLETGEFSVRDVAERDDKNGAVDSTRPVVIAEPTEYKLSEINGSGVYLPPSPPESKRSFWQSRSNTSTTSSNHRSLLNDSEPFNMSRESFDSYRRSFDISARSPVPSEYNVPTRQSLDSRRALQQQPRTSLTRAEGQLASRIDGTAEEGFEDVKLNEDGRPKKKGIFGFGGQASPKPLSDIERPSSGHHFFTSRKRGQSGGGAELKAMERPTSRNSQTRAVEEQAEDAAGER